MYWVIQEDVFREKHYKTLIKMVERFDFEYEIVKFRPFVPVIDRKTGKCAIDFKTKRKDVFCWGAVAMANVANQYGWYPGSQMNANHDVEVYGKYYDLLNSDGHVIDVDDPVPFDNYIFFARPTKDTKAFTGSVFTQDSWKDWVETMKNEIVTSARPDFRLIDKFKGETKVFVAPVKQIYQEIRCWVVNKKVVTISQYKLGDRVVYENLDYDQEAIDFAQSMVDRYQPNEAFVIDICRTEQGFKVVEVNSINCAGFYEVNMQKLLMALDDYFGPRTEFKFSKKNKMCERLRTLSRSNKHQWRRTLRNFGIFLNKHFQNKSLQEVMG